MPSYHTYETLNKIKSFVNESKESLDRDVTDEEILDMFPKYNEIKCLSVDEYDEFAADEFELTFKCSVVNKKLRDARLKRLLKQGDIAKQLGISGMSYGNIERCLIYPSAEIREKIYAILRPTASNLFPQWLEIFTDKWKRMEKQKSVKVNTVSFDSVDEKALMTDGDVEHAAETSLLKREDHPLQLAIKSLHHREQKVIKYRYGFDGEESHTLMDTAEEFDVTRERIRQIEVRALEKIQNFLLANKVWLGP
ncbi:MAG: sigma factor-like helix-turn-helix DNA-binding protein [Methanogenium sp.]|jgi:transcriptional regulator with XRE-family HTH domain